jgi:hypothetical protein
VENKAIGQFRAKLREIERAVWIQTKSEALCCGVTMAQCHAIMEIGEAGELNLKDLSARLGLDNSTLSRTVESLVQDGLADRKARKTGEQPLFDSMQRGVPLATVSILPGIRSAGICSKAFRERNTPNLLNP